MTCYRVVWEIDIDAESPKEAVEQALAIQRDPESIATVFTVLESTPHGGGKTFQIDLSEQCGKCRQLTGSDRAIYRDREGNVLCVTCFEDDIPS